MSLAIEPILCIGGINTAIGPDGWTIKTEGIGAHEEHTVFIHEDKVEILT